MDTLELKDIVVIYHDQCRDGFGAAYAAWKKFGGSASYVPRKTQEPVPDGLNNKTIYIVDYSYDKKVLEQLQKRNTSVVVIDHHKTAEESVTAFPENVFDLEHSGAVLTWQYFHRDTSVPLLLQYIEDHDLWKFEMKRTREFGAALGEYPQEFEAWDQLSKELEDKQAFDDFVRHGAIIASFEDKLVENLLTFAERAVFEGHEIYVLNAARIYRSILGNRLAERNALEGGAAMSIVYYRYGGNIHCSLRSRGDFDVGVIAKKYGGGGHKNAASIRVSNFAALPFSFI